MRGRVSSSVPVFHGLYQRPAVQAQRLPGGLQNSVRRNGRTSGFAKRSAGRFQALVRFGL